VVGLVIVVVAAGVFVVGLATVVVAAVEVVVGSVMSARASVSAAREERPLASARTLLVASPLPPVVVGGLVLVVGIVDLAVEGLDVVVGLLLVVVGIVVRAVVVPDDVGNFLAVGVLVDFAAVGVLVVPLLRAEVGPDVGFIFEGVVVALALARTAAVSFALTGVAFAVLETGSFWTGACAG